MYNKVLLTICTYTAGLSQPGCVVAGPKSRGGVHDLRYGCEPSSSGAAFHLLHLAQKVRSPIAADTILDTTSFWGSVLMNSTCQSAVPKPSTPHPSFVLKRVWQSKRKLEVYKWHVWEAEARSALLKQQGNVEFGFLPVCWLPILNVYLSKVRFFSKSILVTQSHGGGESHQRWHEISAERFGQRGQGDLCKPTPPNGHLFSVPEKVVVVIPAWLCVHRALRRKWSFFRGLWAPRHGQTKP